MPKSKLNNCSTKASEPKTDGTNEKLTASSNQYGNFGTQYTDNAKINDEMYGEVQEGGRDGSEQQSENSEDEETQNNAEDSEDDEIPDNIAKDDDSAILINRLLQS
ncbi:hypothetical protein HDU76_010598 [Blyttiomyces sp. JEL0837]|nr:hypothetical protein HDU76_010598 [Blyttiomyces sp. JEL0837]